jgi:hypothetical protein
MATKPKQQPPTQESNGGAAVCNEPRTPQVLRWDPAKIVQARVRCSYGDFSLFSDLCEAMMPDDRVSMCLEKLYAAATLPLTFQLPGVDAEKSKDDPVVQALQSDFWKIFPEQTLRTAFRWIALADCALLHVDGWRLDTETGRVLPIISVWALRHLRNDPEKGWVVRVAARSGDYFGDEQQITPGDGNWAVMIMGSSWRSICQARGHGVALFWLLKQYALVDWPNSSERHGQGTNVAQCDDVAKASKLAPKDRIELAADMAKMARNGNLVMPPGWKYDLATDTANSYQTFEAQINAANSGIVIGINGTNLTSEVKGGSFAAASVHESVDAGRMRGLLEFAATGFREQILGFWCTYNFSGVSVAPYPKWDTTPPADKKAEAEARLADAQALKTYREAQAQLDQVAWFEGKVALIPGASVEFPAMTASAPSVAPAAAPKKAQAFAAAEPINAFERGRGYIDELEGNMVALAAKGLVPTVSALVEAVSGADSYEDAKIRVVAAYANSRAPTALVQGTERALIMGQLAGAETVEQELTTEE